MLESGDVIPPGYRLCVDSPTPEELKAEQDRRAAKARKLKALEDFRARRDVQAMESIRDLIENYPETVIQALEPERWVFLRDEMRLLVGDDAHQVVAERLGLTEPTLRV